MGMNIRGIWEKLERFKYPLLILALGVVLMLAPGKTAAPAGAVDSGTQLSQILSRCEGIGAAQVIVSDEGVVVACQGAENAKTRLEILHAVNSYTGFGSDRITVLRLVD